MREDLSKILIDEEKYFIDEEKILIDEEFRDEEFR